MLTHTDEVFGGGSGAQERRGEEGGWGGLLELIKIMSGSASCSALASTPPCISQGWRPFSLGNGGSIETKVKGCASCLLEVIEHLHTVLLEMVLLYIVS